MLKLILVNMKKNDAYNNYMRVYKSERRNTLLGRAEHLLMRYKQSDKIYNRGDSDLTPQWIVEHIFSQPCAHCGATDWKILGCNRLDNSKPHTMDNVEPCCWKCNQQLQQKDSSKQVFQYTIDGKLIKIWDSTNECGRNGFDQSTVAACCRGDYGFKTHKGYKWSYEPL